MFDNKSQAAATEGIKGKCTNQSSEMKTGEKEKAFQRAKKLQKTVFLVGGSMIERSMDIYSLSSSIINSWPK